MSITLLPLSYNLNDFSPLGFICIHYIRLICISHFPVLPLEVLTTMVTCLLHTMGHINCGLLHDNMGTNDISEGIGLFRMYSCLNLEIPFPLCSQ